MILLPITLALVAASGPTDAPVRKAIESAVVYLQEDGVDWVRIRKCASCHHAPLGIWSLQEARSRGFAVDQAALNELVKYTVEDPIGAKLLSESPKDGGKDGSFAITATYGALAGRSVAPASVAAKAGLAKLEDYLIRNQNADGSWSSGAGRPPMQEGAEVTTLMTALALGDETGTLGRMMAMAWLDARPPASLQARALRLLLAARAGLRPKPSDVDALVALQKEDGGWAQAPGLASDAYATGLSLYALSGSGLKADRPEIARAREFLVRTQEDDGSWPMASRPAKEGDKPAKDLQPITYAGTAWATLGLLRSSDR